MKQTETLNTLTKHAHVATAVLASLVALAGLSNAQSMPSTHSHKTRTGNLIIAAPTEVGGAILQPGDYEVREAKSPDGPVVEFVHHFRNELASELVQADEEEVVARVKFTGYVLSAAPEQTQLQFASDNNNATRLEIRGNAVDYVFTQAQLAAQR